jgi:hypothetical protein
MPSNESDLVRQRHEHLMDLELPKKKNEDQTIFEVRRKVARESIAAIDRILYPPPPPAPPPPPPPRAIWYIAGYDIEVRDWADHLALVGTALAIPVGIQAFDPLRRFYFFWRHQRVPYPHDYIETFAISQQWDEAFTQRIIKNRYKPRLHKHYLVAGAACVGVYGWAAHLWWMMHRNSSQ